jgi:hypothetical protein
VANFTASGLCGSGGSAAPKGFWVTLFLDETGVVREVVASMLPGSRVRRSKERYVAS